MSDRRDGEGRRSDQPDEDRGPSARETIQAAARLLDALLEKEQATGVLEDPGQLNGVEPEVRAALEEMLDDVRRFRAHRSSIGGAPTAGDRLGRYQLVAEIGRGSSSTVWRAHDTEVDRPVAVKVLHPEQGLSELQLTRFQRESRIAGSLSHRGVLTLLDIGSDRGLHFIVTEFIEDGRTLARLIEEERRLAERNLTGRAAARFLLQLADAVGALHQAGVVHRDLKPANVLLRPSGTPVVADLGLATRPGDGGLLTSRSGAGTPFYRSPEQVRELKDLDARSDVFSLGVTVYEVLTGRRPFEAASTQEVNRLILERDPTPLRQVRSDVPADLETICLHALEKDPARRYPDAAELAADLRRFLDHRPIHARAAGPVRRLLKLTRRRPVASTALTALVALLLVAGVALRSISARSREVLRTNAELRRSQAAVRTTLSLAEEALQLLEPGASHDRETIAALVRMLGESAREEIPTRPATAGRQLLAAASFATRFGHFEDAVALTGECVELAESAPASAGESLSELIIPARLQHLRALRLLLDREEIQVRGERYLSASLADATPTQRCMLLLEVLDAAAAREDDACLARMAERHGDVAQEARARIEELAALPGDDRATERLQLQHLLASYLHRRHDYEPALVLIERTFEELRDRDGLHDHRTIRAGLLLARTLNWGLVYGLKEPKWTRLDLARLLWPAAQATLGPSSRLTVTARWTLGESLLNSGFPEEALEHYQQVLARLIELDGAESLRAESCTVALAVVYSRLGRLSEAEDLFRRMGEVHATRYGPEHHDALIPRRGLAETYLYQGRLDEAAAEFERHLEVFARNRETVGDRPAVTTAHYLVQIACRQGRPDRVRALKAFLEEFLEGDPEERERIERAFEVFEELAWISRLLDSGEVDAAVRRARAVLQRHASEGSPSPMLAEQELQHALSILLQAGVDFPAVDLTTGSRLFALAIALRRGAEEEAARLFEEHSVEILRETRVMRDATGSAERRLLTAIQEEIQARPLDELPETPSRLLALLRHEE